MVGSVRGKTGTSPVASVAFQPQRDEMVKGGGCTAKENESEINSRGSSDFPPLTQRGQDVTKVRLKGA